jgi:hypothetical protein
MGDAGGNGRGVNWRGGGGLIAMASFLSATVPTHQASIALRRNTKANMSESQLL